MSVIPIQGIDHVVIRCRGFDAMLGFYRDVLGCTLAKHNEKLGIHHLRAGNALIDLVGMASDAGRRGGPPPGPDGHNVDHVCLQVDPFDAEAICAWLRRHGVEPEEAKPRFGATGDGPSIYLMDPDGNRVELKGPAQP